MPIPQNKLAIASPCAASMGDIFDLELHDAAEAPLPLAPSSPTADRFNLSQAEAENLCKKYDFTTVKRIEYARKVLGDYSLLLKHSKEAHEPIARTRSKFQAQTLPQWTLQIEKELFDTRPHHQYINKDTPIAVISPSTEFADFGEESRPGSLYTPGSASYTASLYRFTRNRHE